jgi:hypothetical protein
MGFRVHLYIPPKHRSVEHIMSGFRMHGIEPRIMAAPRKCDLAVVWGFRKFGPLPNSQHRRLLVFERGYMLKRRMWPSVGYDGLNGYADFCNTDVGSERWDNVFASAMKPWRTEDRGNYVLIMGQVPGDVSLRGLDPHLWCFKIAKELEALGIPAAIRWHPKSDHSPRTRFKVLPANMPLGDALAGARYVVVYNSNTAVDAVMQGIPAVTMDRGSMAYGVTGHDPLVYPPTPDRTQWMHRMAYTQWCMDGRGKSINEVAHGDFWDHLAKGMQE